MPHRVPSTPLARLRGCRRAGTLLLAVLLGVSCGGAGEPPRPRNVLLISIDTLRADHLGCYGYPRPISPNLDRLALEGVLFEEARSPTAWTLQGHASMLSGTSPARNVTQEGSLRVREDVPLVAELLQERGFQTGAVVNASLLKERFGFARGMDEFRFIRNVKGAADRHREAVRELVDTFDAERPWFLFVHYMSVHSPYSSAPEDAFRLVRPYEGELTRGDNRVQMLEIDEGKRTIDAADARFLIDLYDGAIATTDRRLDELFADLALLGLDDTVVVLTSDHGEEFLDHGHVLHTRTLYEEVLRIPLIVAGPGIPRGRVVGAPVSLVDVVPTVFDLLGLPALPGLDGRSLAPLWESDAALPDPTVELATFQLRTGSSKWGILRGRAKLVVDLETGESSFFDLSLDPQERTDLYPHPRAETLEKRLRSLGPPRYAVELDVDEEARERLRALGYIK